MNEFLQEAMFWVDTFSTLIMGATLGLLVAFLLTLALLPLAGSLGGL